MIDKGWQPAFNRNECGGAKRVAESHLCLSWWLRSCLKKAWKAAAKKGREAMELRPGRAIRLRPADLLTQVAIVPLSMSMKLRKIIFDRTAG